MKPNFYTLFMRLAFCSIIVLQATKASTQIYYNDFVRSDRQWEFDINVGPTNFLGDVGGGKGKGTLFLKDLNLAVTNIFYGANVTYYPNQWLGIRAGFNMGKLSGFDSLIKSQGSVERDRKNRNLGFRTDIAEANLSLEIYPTAFFARKESFFNNKLRPYFNVGFGVFRFNPQGIYEASNGQKRWVDLKPLRLEGQGMAEYPDRKEYSNIAFQIPFGFGIKYFINEQWYIATEIMQRYTFTDYIDDVSKTYVDPALFSKYLPKDQVAIAEQMMFKRALVNNRPVSDFIGKNRGDASNKDYYLSLFLKIGFRFGARDTDFSCPSGRRSIF
ncbi:MAG: hypothetical protein H3C56_03615 [Chitinophagaceae bacterium]|nr:hypothetical protein [Chitinophagaceae bacterium]